MSILQPPILSTSVVKIEPPTVKKNEPPEPEIMNIDFDEDIKNIDIVSHPLTEDLIKSETVPENIFESKHSEYVEAQAFVKADNVSLVQIENIIECEKTEDTDNGNGTWDTGQETVIQFSCDRCDFKTRYRRSLKAHNIIHLKPEESQYFYCDHCSFKSRHRNNLKKHIFILHNNQNVERFSCDHCDYKTPTRGNLKKHNLIHLKPLIHCDHCSFKSRHKNDLKIHIFRLHNKNGKRFRCDHCNYESRYRRNLKKHNKIHLKPEDTQYFYCSHCSFKTKYKKSLSGHQASRNCKNVEIEQRFRCDHCDYKTQRCGGLKEHNIIHLKPEEVQYFYCSHCSFKFKRKNNLRRHILRHFQKEEVKFCCYICDFMTFERELIISHIKTHSEVRNKSKINEGN